MSSHSPYRVKRKTDPLGLWENSVASKAAGGRGRLSTLSEDEEQLASSIVAEDDRHRMMSHESKAYAKPVLMSEDSNAEVRLHPKSKKYLSTASFLFWCLFFLQIATNFDNGCVPAVLVDITKEFGLSSLSQGLLLSFQYVGLTAMSPISGILLQSKVRKNYLLSFCIFMNAVSVLLLAFAPSDAAWLALCSRIFIGLSQATFVIFAPVWVDEFAPENKQALWLSLCQAGIPLGIMVGYATAGIMRANNGGWRTPLILQGILLCPFSAGLFFVPKQFLDVSGDKLNSFNNSSGSSHGSESTQGRKQSLSDEYSFRHSPPPHRKGSDEFHVEDPNGSLLIHRRASESGDSVFSLSSVGSGRPRSNSTSATTLGRQRVDSLMQYVKSEKGESALSIGKQIKILLRSSMFVYMSLALSSLFFVVTGIQQWITLYLTDAVKADYGQVVMLFTISSATGPTLGVFFGGWLCDKIGGYKGEVGLARSSKLVTCFAILAVGSACPAGFTSDLNSIMLLLWLLLFWGGAIMPIATGLILSSVPVALRSFSSAVSMCTYNLLGYSLGGFLPGLLQEIVESNLKISHERSLAWGVRLILFWSLFGLLFSLLAATTSHRKMIKSLAEPSPRRRHRKKKKEKVAREIEELVEEAGGIVFDAHLDFDSTASSPDIHGRPLPVSRDSAVSDGGDFSDDDEYIDVSLTPGELRYEIARQYVPVTNVLQELANSWREDYTLPPIVSRDRSQTNPVNNFDSLNNSSGRINVTRRYSFDEV